MMRFWDLVYIEAYKLLRQRKTYFAVAAVLVIELIVIGVALYQGQAVLDTLEDLGALQEREDGSKGVSLEGREHPVTLVKGDGSGLYLTRDCAAVVDRKRKFDFQRCIYVTDKAQEMHFQVRRKVFPNRS